MITEMKRAVDHLKDEVKKREEIDRESTEWVQHSDRMDALLDRYLQVTGRG